MPFRLLPKCCFLSVVGILCSCYLLTPVPGLGIPAPGLRFTALLILEYTLCESMDPTGLQPREVKLLSNASPEIKLNKNVSLCLWT